MRESIVAAIAPTRTTRPTEGSRREYAKGERRARIVKAAHDLLRQVGVDELSMRAVADRAGVSLSTVYNLFESKQAILARVFDEDLAAFEQRVAGAHSTDVLQRIFDALDIACDLYEADPAFYRATMVRPPAGSGDAVLQASVREPRVSFWHSLIAAAVAEGWLRAASDPAVVGTLLVQVFSGIQADWIAGEISAGALRRELRFGFAVTLLAFATQPAATRLGAMAVSLQGELSALRG
jgi:AcrR family transcriptional regulator